MEIGGDGNGSGESHSQQSSSSDSGQALAFTKRIMEQVEEALRTGGGEGKTIIVTIVHQGNGAFEDVGRVELRSSEDNLLAGGARKMALELKFLGEVPDTVRTSTVLTSKNEECLKLVLVDSETGEIVDCVPESSAEAEIVVLEGENDMSRENFERRIIKIGEKKKPHFVKRVYINLKEGVGYLMDVKLGQDSGWTNKCKCRLGARIGQSLYEWTQPFEVIDKRDKDNEKHYPPKLSSEVWRLVQICKDGKPCKRLTGKNIETLGDFHFWFHVNPQGLKEILLGVSGGDSKWKAIVAHAETCTTDDQRMHYDDDPRMYCHKSPNEPQTSVVYNFVGKLKGVIKESHFFPIDNLSAHEKDHAYELLGSVLDESAFLERYNTPFDVEASLPYRSSHEVNASTSSSLQSLSEHIYPATERGSSSQSIDPNNAYDSVPSHSLISEEMATRALRYLCAGNVAVCRSITESQALLCLAVLLEKGEGEVKYNSAMALMEITAVAEQDYDLRKSAFKPTAPVTRAVVDQFLRIVERANCELLLPSIRSIGNLARTFRATETRFIPPLVNLLDNREPEVSCEAALALNKFAGPDNFLHDTHCKAIISSGGHKHLIPLIYFGEQMVKIPSFVLLCYLAMHVPDSETLVQEDVLIAMEWWEKQPHLMQDEALVNLVYEAKKRFELYQSRVSKQYH